MDANRINALQQTIWGYYNQSGRHELPWRQPEPDGRFDAYKIMVSEIMLQQTQVGRVIVKYQEFLATFPTISALATAPLSAVLRLWSGLGYNRRAKFLWQAAQIIQAKHNGVVPADLPTLVGLPGIGRNTAGAILAYAYNQPVPFLETNIRTVYIHHFFADEIKIPDGMLLPLVKATLPSDRPRAWYWALMDYGTHLKQTVGNLSRASSAYTKQTKFEGSRRQIRGRVLKVLADASPTLAQLQGVIPDERLPEVVQELLSEGFITRHQEYYQLADA